jgi:nucleoside-diphosphate-sugar epimerase
MNRASTILLTGSAGRIGRAVLCELNNRGHAVRCFDRVATPGHPDAIVADLTDAAALKRAAEGAGTIVHLAATPDDADFLSDLVPNNVIGVYNVFEAARLAGVRRLVLASSGQVVWGSRTTGPWPVPVDVQLTPRYWYAALKVFVEAAGRAFADAHGMSVIVARLGWCPRTREHAEELQGIDWGPDVYLSPGDAGRFFALAVEAPESIRYSILYVTSRPATLERYELKPAREQLGYVPRDRWPEGAEGLVTPGTKE